MKNINITRIIIGSIVLIGIVLSELVSRDWILLSSFAGVMMIVSGFTGCCPLSILLRQCDCSISNKDKKDDK